MKKTARLKTKYLFLLVIFFACLTGFLLIFYFSAKNKSLSKQPAIAPEKADALRQDYQKLVDYAGEKSNENTSTGQKQDECWKIKTNPSKGIILKVEIDKEQEIYDFTYTGKVVGLEKIKQNSCEYYQLALEKPNGFQYFLLFPLDLFYDDPSLGQITADVFGRFMDQEAQFSLKLKKIGQDIWQIIQWNSLRFYIN